MPILFMHGRTLAVRRLSFSLGVFMACLHSHAQTTPASAPAGGAPSLGEVTVTGNPLGSLTPATASSLRGEALLLRSRSSLGETLDGLPGVSSSYFGPNASRPMIRGLEGDRIRILSNGGSALDLSGLSQDHAVSMDPLSVERIEVLRGPGALLYGGSAVGGVVNVIDNRIAREPLFGPQGGVSGKADLGWTSGSAERAGALMLEAGNDRIQLHVDAFDRQAGDVPAPRELSCDRDGQTVLRRRICNSASRSDGGAVGVSWFAPQATLGLSASSHRSRYGVVAEDDVTVGMRANRYAMEGELRQLPAPLRSLRWSLGHSDYAHTEFGAEEVTRFASRSNEMRLQARHLPVGAWEGVVGLQLDGTRFSAAGEEVFAPPSKTRQAAVFLHEERALPWGRFSVGGRLESVRVESLGAGERFEPGRRHFTPASLALGAQRPLSGGWQLSGNLAYTERAPRDYELFAHGPHIATAAYEQGDRSLDKERSTHLDLGAQWRSGPHRLAANVYLNRFGNYIALTPTGAEQDGLDAFKYQQAPATFRGFELSGVRRLLSGPGALDLGLRADLVRAENRLTGQPLPRIAPWRVGATLNWTQAAWTASLGADHAGEQRRVPVTADGRRPGATSAYTLWHASAGYRQRVGQAQLLWYARLDNLTDELAYSATSVLTTTVFPKAPLPGRMLKAGLQLSF